MNERISFPLNRKSVATGRNKGFLQDIFSQDGKTASKILEEMVSTIQKISFH